MQGKYLSPPALSPRSRTTPLAHIAGRAPESLILFLSWVYCESLLMKRARVAKVADVIAETYSRSGICCIYPS